MVIYWGDCLWHCYTHILNLEYIHLTSEKETLDSKIGMASEAKSWDWNEPRTLKDCCNTVETARSCNEEKPRETKRNGVSNLQDDEVTVG